MSPQLPITEYITGEFVVDILPRVEKGAIRDLLIALDRDNPISRWHAYGVGGFRHSGSNPCDMDVKNAQRETRKSVVKFVNNPQEDKSQSSRKVVSTELICARLGLLFVPPITSEGYVVEVPEAVIIAEDLRFPKNGEIPATGDSFGSQLVDGAVDTKAGAGAWASVEPPAAARIVGYQTWLCGHDPAALVAPDQGQVLSVDHGYYFARGGRWQDLEWNVEPCVPANLDRGVVSDRWLYSGFLDELAALPEERIVQAFASVPSNWNLSLDFRVELAHWVLRRREEVPAAINVLCGGE